VPRWLPIVVFVALLAACGTSSSSPNDAASSRIDKCADRLLSRASGGSTQQARRYAIDTYCAPFERNGWVYDDGALSIAAQHWLDNGERCATAATGQPARTVPCDELNRAAGTQVIDCALLHHVRRAEVRAYLAGRHVQCDDGTPLDDLGVA
jgi:hypothetical protein